MAVPTKVMLESTYLEANTAFVLPEQLCWIQSWELDALGELLIGNSNRNAEFKSHTVPHDKTVTKKQVTITAVFLPDKTEGFASH